MSADEIRRLAEDCHKKSWCYGLDTIEHRIEANKESALLAYAATVERCEKARRKLVAMTDKNSPAWSLDSHAAALDDIDKIDYILHGDAGKGADDGNR